MLQFRRFAAASAGVLALALSATTSPALAGTSDVTWALGQTTTTYGGDTQFHASPGGALVQYRWIDTLTKDTVISGNSCVDFAPIGTSVYNAGDTSYHSLFQGVSNQCFLLRGRVASGQGSTTTRTGRVSR